MADKKKLRNDIILISAVLLISLVAFGVYTFTKNIGKYVTVSVNGKRIASYSLSKDRTENISSENGECTNTLVIKDGKAKITKASCPDKICVGHPAVSRTGETIVCLPNKVVITVTE